MNAVAAEDFCIPFQTQYKYCWPFVFIFYLLLLITTVLVTYDEYKDVHNWNSSYFLLLTAS